MIQARDRGNVPGKLVIVSGPSGVGKTTICREAVKRLDSAYLSVSMTTRAKGPGEENGLAYWFVSPEEFRRRIDEGLFLEYAEVFGNLYGTPKDKTDDALRTGKTVILAIDVQGGRQVKTVYPRAVMIFLLPPSTKVLAERLGHRGRDSAAVAAKRLGGAGSEMAAARQYYEHRVINDDLEQAIREVVRIIEQSPGIEDQGNIGDK